MSLRITKQMLFSRSLQDIQNATRERVRLQEVIASGRRVNRPSDDPAATLRILPLRAELRDLAQMAENASLAKESLVAGTNALEEGSRLLQRLRELTVQAANGTLTQRDRTSIGGEVEQLLQQMLAIANTNHDGRRLFAGTDSGAAPFRLVSDGGGARVVYDGDRFEHELEVSPGVRTAVGVPGERIFGKHLRGDTSYSPGTTGARWSGATDTGVGFARMLVEFQSLTIPGGTTGLAAGTGDTTALGDLSYVYNSGANTLSINGGPATVISGGSQTFPVGSGGSVSLNVATPIVPASGTLTSNAQLSLDGGVTYTSVTNYAPGAEVVVRDSFSGEITNVAVDALRLAGSEELRFAGTFDVFTALIAVRDSLQNAAGLPDATVAARLSSLLGEIDFAHDAVLEGARDQGDRTQHVELLRARVQSLDESTQDALSRIADADFAEAVLALQRQEFGYEAALRVGARILETSLLDYMR